MYRRKNYAGRYLERGRKYLWGVAILFTFQIPVWVVNFGLGYGLLSQVAPVQVAIIASIAISILSYWWFNIWRKWAVYEIALYPHWGVGRCLRAAYRWLAVSWGYSLAVIGLPLGAAFFALRAFPGVHWALVLIGALAPTMIASYFIAKVARGHGKTWLLEMQRGAVEESQERILRGLSTSPEDQIDYEGWADIQNPYELFFKVAEFLTFHIIIVGLPIVLVARLIVMIKPGTADIMPFAAWFFFMASGYVRYENRLHSHKDILVERDDIEQPNLITGMSLMSHRQIAKLKEEQGRIKWGADVVGFDKEMLHYLIFANTGRGKTTYLKMFFAWVLPYVNTEYNNRAVLFDLKNEFPEILEALGVPYVVLNPFLEQGAAWAIHKDIRNSDQARDLAELLLFKAYTRRGEVWTEDAAVVLTAIFTTFSEKYNRGEIAEWTFGDVLRVIQTAEDTKYLRRLLRQSEEFKYLERKFHPPTNERHFYGLDVLRNLQPLVGEFRSMAAAWEDPSKPKVSLSDWIENNYILVLGYDPTRKKAMGQANRFWFSMLSKLLESKENIAPGSRERSWVFMDESLMYAPVENLEDILQTGRSKGVCYVMTVLNYAGMANKYGHLLSESIVGLFRHIACLGCDKMTAQWLSTDVFPSFRALVSETRIGGFPTADEVEDEDMPPEDKYTRVNVNAAMKTVEKVAVEPQLLTDMPAVDKQRGIGISGVWYINGRSLHQHEFTWGEMEEYLPKSTGSKVEGMVPYPDYSRVTKLSPFSEELLSYLQLDDNSRFAEPND